MSASSALSEQIAGGNGQQLVDFVFITPTLAAPMVQQSVGPEEFLRLSAEPGAVVLDVRRAKDRAAADWSYTGAQALPDDEITAQTAFGVAPDKNAPVLLVCNYAVRSQAVAAMTRAVPATNEAADKLTALGYRRVYYLQRGASGAPGFDRLPIHIVKEAI